VTVPSGTVSVGPIHCPRTNLKCNGSCVARMTMVRLILAAYRSAGPIVLLLLVGCIATALTPCLGRVDDSTLKARVLYLGDSSYPANKLVLQWIIAEPKFQIVIVPCDTYFIGLPEALKMTRLYLPRSYQALNASQDVVIIHDISPRIIPPNVIGFIHRALEEEGFGVGLICFMFWGGTNEIAVWMSLAFYEAFPADVDLGTEVQSYMGRTYWSVVKKDPILNLPDIEKQPMQTLGNHGGDIWPRPGSVVHAIWKGRNTPVLVTGDYGSGRTLQLGQGWHNPASEVFQNYRFMPDLTYNQLYFLADISPPEDLELAHRARELFIDVRTRKSVTISTMEFVDKFGARLDRIEEELGDLGEDVVDAERDYLAGDYAAAAEILNGVMEAYPSIEKHLADLKNRTLFWVHTFEWVSVMATGLIGSVVPTSL